MNPNLMLVRFDATPDCDPKLLDERGPMLVTAALSLGIRSGCRIVLDGPPRIDFLWTPYQQPQGHG